MLQKSPMYAYIPATDVVRARAFYEQKLGFTPKEQVAGGVEFEEYDMPGMKTDHGIATAGGAKAAWFKDTEGNTLAIIEDVRK